MKIKSGTRRNGERKIFSEVARKRERKRAVDSEIKIAREREQ